MHPIRRILVAIKEPDARSNSALLHKAAQLARGLDAHLELFHALTQPIYAESYLYTNSTFQEIQDRERARTLKRLLRLAGRIQGHGRQRALSMSVAAQWDSPGYEAVIRRAVASKSDLIVAERHHGRHVAPYLLHFNDWELLRQSPVPVLLVKRPGLYRRPRVLAAVDPTHSMDKPADLDAGILELSTAIAQALHGSLSAVHAYMPIPAATPQNWLYNGETATVVEARLARAARRRFERILGAYPIPKSRRHLLGLPAVDAIQQVVRKSHCDIVALGAVSRSGWRRLLIGNTAEALLDPLPCDLLVVKPPRFRTQIDRKTVGARLVSMMPAII